MIRNLNRRRSTDNKRFVRVNQIKPKITMDSLDKLVIGATDVNGNHIKRIFSRGDSYVIYEIETDISSDSLRVMINPDNDPKFVSHETNYEEIKKEVNEIKAVLFKGKRENALKHLIAPAISKGIKGDTSGAKAMLNELKTRIENEYLDSFKKKIYYSASSLLVVLILTALSYWTYCDWISWGTTDKSLTKLFLYSATAGSLGGYISLALKLRKIDIDSGLPISNVLFYGIERMIISVFNGILIVIIIRSDLLLSVINQSDNPQWGYLTFSIIAGFSENYIPDVLNKLEKDK